MRLGWSAGASVEWMFNPKWSVKAEYLYYDLGTANTANVGPLFYTSTSGAFAGGSVVAHTGLFDGHVIRMGVHRSRSSLNIDPGSGASLGRLPSSLSKRVRPLGRAFFFAAVGRYAV